MDGNIGNIGDKLIAVLVVKYVLYNHLTQASNFECVFVCVIVQFRLIGNTKSKSIQAGIKVCIQYARKM